MVWYTITKNFLYMSQISTQPPPEQAAIMADYKAQIAQLKLKQDAIFAQTTKDIAQLALEQTRAKLGGDKNA